MCLTIVSPKSDRCGHTIKLLPKQRPPRDEMQKLRSSYRITIKGKKKVFEKISNDTQIDLEYFSKHAILVFEILFAKKLRLDILDPSPSSELSYPHILK